MQKRHSERGMNLIELLAFLIANALAISVIPALLIFFGHKRLAGESFAVVGTAVLFFWITLSLVTYLDPRARGRENLNLRRNLIFSAATVVLLEAVPARMILKGQDERGGELLARISSAVLLLCFVLIIVARIRSVVREERGKAKLKTDN